MKKELLVIFMLVMAVFLIVGCSRITASFDKQGKEGLTQNVQENPLPQEPAAATQNKSEPSSNPTGNMVAEIEVPPHQNYTVKMTVDGFNPDTLSIKAGDTVIWKNTRSGNINQAMIIGVRECHQVRSRFLNPGQSYSWTFDKPMTCTIADGVMTTKESKIIVE